MWVDQVKMKMLALRMVTLKGSPSRLRESRMKFTCSRALFTTRPHLRRWKEVTNQADLNHPKAYHPFPSTHSRRAGVCCSDHFLRQEEMARAKYAALAENVETISSLGGNVLFGVDATRCHAHKTLKKGAGSFERIVFNFPHLGSGMKDQARNITQHQELLRGTFRAALPLLAAAPLVLLAPSVAQVSRGCGGGAAAPLLPLGTARR